MSGKVIAQFTSILVCTHVAASPEVNKFWVEFAQFDILVAKKYLKSEFSNHYPEKRATHWISNFVYIFIR